MKRDLELIRHILLTLEDCDYSHRICIDNFTSASYDEPTVSYHINLLLDCGYIEARTIDICGAPYDLFIVERMTSQGHDYLDGIRDDTIWNETKKKIGKVTSSVSLEIVKSVSQTIILGLIGS